MGQICRLLRTVLALSFSHSFIYSFTDFTNVSVLNVTGGMLNNK